MSQLVSQLFIRVRICKYGISIEFCSELQEIRSLPFCMRQVGGVVLVAVALLVLSRGFGGMKFESQCIRWLEESKERQRELHAVR